jgi:ribosome biogenesis SPOUT family RNA methylase Rps3
LMVVVEHMEDGASRWLLEEYREAAEVALRAGHRFLVTGVEDPAVAALLARRGLPVARESACTLLRGRLTILLDPAAPKPLEPWEARAADAVVVGGIMGDHPPRGRTYLLAARCPDAARRNLGPHQLSVDGAVKVALMIASGTPLDSVKLVYTPSLNVETPLGVVEVELPYAYPLRDGKPWLPRGLPRLLERGIMWDEAVLEPGP